MLLIKRKIPAKRQRNTSFIINLKQIRENKQNILLRQMLFRNI